MTETLLRSPLYERHVALGAKFGAFGGWEMPLEYAGGGVLREHAAVRGDVGVFDVSHLGKATVRGAGAVAFLNSCLTNDLGRLRAADPSADRAADPEAGRADDPAGGVGAGRAQYTLCCDESGGVVDDLIAYVHADNHVLLIPNAANTAEVVRRLQAAAPAGVEVVDEHRAYAVLAVQGPRSAQLLTALSLPTEHAYMSFALARLRSASADGVELTVCRTGYTGEHGYELVVASDQAGAVWDELFRAGATLGALPCGLGARDTLRTEMGYPLHGQDLSLQISPVQARLGWAIGWAKPAFWGRDALMAERAAGPRRLLWGLEALDRGIPRPHMVVLAGDQPVGEVTSGTFSPTKRVGIALALIDTSAGVAEGHQVEVDVRGKRCPMRVVKPPFVTPSVR